MPEETEAPVSGDLVWAAVLAERGRAERVARARCASPQEAEDCVQEALARVAAMPDLDLARVGPMLSTVVANLAVDGHRSRSRAIRAMPRLAAAASPDPGHEELICDVHEARWLWERRNCLAAQDRAVLELRARGLTVAETADALGLSYKAAESSYTRARAKMRAIWRGTAAALGVLWARPREAAPVAAAAVAAAAAVLAGALPESDSRPAGPRTEASQNLSAASADATFRVERRPPRTADAPVPRTRVASPGTAARASPAPAEPIARVPGVSIGPVVAEQGRLQREHDEETFLETVERCVRNGVEVSPTTFECRDDPPGTAGSAVYGKGTQYFPPG